MKTPASKVLQTESSSEKETERIGVALGKSITSGTIFIKGEMGVGKTALCRGFVGSIGQDFLGSPTFTFVQEYAGVFHWDLYRIDDPKEFLTRGLTEIQVQAGVHLVEWPAKIHAKLLLHYPKPHYALEIKKGKNETRKITLLHG